MIYVYYRRSCHEWTRARDNDHDDLLMITHLPAVTDDDDTHRAMTVMDLLRSLSSAAAISSHGVTT